MRVRILPSAKGDLRQGFHFYQSQDPGVGDYFRDFILAEIDTLASYAGIHRFRGGLHRFLAHKFPYWIYYRVDGQVVYVVAILDARQDPRTIAGRENRESQRKL